MDRHLLHLEKQSNKWCDLLTSHVLSQTCSHGISLIITTGCNLITELLFA